MANAALTTETAGRGAASRPASGRLLAQLRFAVVFYGIITMLVLAALNLPGSHDYVGADNDDVTRLIEVRDLLAGQNWFDMQQYRLGLEGGTPMHWSRLVDLPIANLISFFDLFLPHTAAEAAALAAWPMGLAVALLFVMGLAGRRIGGTAVMHAAMGLTAIYLITSNRFLPGAIDHHNVQLLLMTIIAAMLVDPERRPASFAIAGLAVALAIAVGVETVPHVAVACLIVAGLWAWHGADIARPTRAFCIALVIGMSVAFFSTVPPSLYGLVTCDSLSLGFYGLTSVGATMLFASTFAANGFSMPVRLAALGASGIMVLSALVTLAPQCLGNPLSDLDPMIVNLWLANVSEAQSLFQLTRLEPGSVGGFYGTGIFALFVCAFRIWRRDRVEMHAVLGALLLVSVAVAIFQVRGAAFPNLLAILPLALLLMEIRRIANADPENMGAGFVYIVMAFLCVPSAWALGGVLGAQGVKGLVERSPFAEAKPGPRCMSQSALAQLSALEPGVVASSIELGAAMLRFTPHRILSAPYHRNQGGILTEMYIGLSNPQQAQSFLRGAGVTVIAYCPGDWQTQHFAELEPQGLYADLARGKIPAYLEALPAAEGSDLLLYRVRPEEK